MPKILSSVKSIAGFRVDLQECPFREFKDFELSPDFWGMDPSGLRATVLSQKDKTTTKHHGDSIWLDDQIQPLPRSVRHYLHNYIRADELASTRFDADIVVFDDKDGGRISASDYMLNHVQVLQRSSFCRKVLSACFILERMEGLIVEHQWDGFLFSFGTEGWRPKFHIYSPGLKPGGGPQHRPGLSKNGCYLVRLFYLGCWRCIWVNDQVPVDATGAPLLPFTYLIPAMRSTPPKSAKQSMTLSSKVVQLWPLLLCKALLKIAVPDMNIDEEEMTPHQDSIQDEDMNDFSIIYALTGSLSVNYKLIGKDTEEVWDLLKREVVAFNWDEEDGSLINNKSKTAKKSSGKESNIVRRKSMATILIKDTLNEPPYVVPGITPCHEMNMLITMVRDLPLKKPLPEPEVPLWKTYRWVDWVKSHGLYKSYECPRTKFLKCTGLLKCSYAPHMMDVRSTLSIAAVNNKEKSKKGTKSAPTSEGNEKLFKEEIRDWIAFNSIFSFIKSLNSVFFPSMLQFASACNFLLSHPNKNSTNKSVDILAPLSSPLYVQIDNPTEFSVKIALEVCHPRVLHNSGQPINDMIEPGTLFLEEFNWLKDLMVPDAKAYLKTRRYDSVDINLPAGRHFFRLWINYHLKWCTMIMTEANLIMGTQDIIQASAARDCFWTSKYLFGLSTAFNNWMKGSKSASQLQNFEKEFYKSYLPDLPWIKETVGYPIAHIHWMFRQALQSLLYKRLSPLEYKQASVVLRKAFSDPYFGIVQKSTSFFNKNSIDNDPCDCVTDKTDNSVNNYSEIHLDDEMISVLLNAPKYPQVSQLCKLSNVEMNCSELRTEREKLIKLNTAAVVIQSYWKKFWVQKCFDSNSAFTTELLKAVIDSAFSNLEALSALMNELFTLFPGVRSAYSVASGLSGGIAFVQHTGTAVVPSKSKWIPLFQGLFFCHHPTKVNFDLRSNVQRDILFVYNNDTGKQLSQINNDPLTYEFKPNIKGFTILGHSSLDNVLQTYNDINWQLSILSSSASDFHICDGLDANYCKELPLQTSTKLIFEEVFIPNRNNILGGLQLSVSKSDCISFRAAVSSPEINILATLKKILFAEETEVVCTCKGKGEIYWPCIVLEGPQLSLQTIKKQSFSNGIMSMAPSAIRSERSIKSVLKSPKTDSSAKRVRSAAKIETIKIRKSEDVINYILEVTAPDGWPLTIHQWSRVEEVRNISEFKFDSQQKKQKERVGSAKEKRPISPTMNPQEGDAYIELEISITAEGGVVVKRDESRETSFLEAKKLWELKEAGRNIKGAQIRKEFRMEYLDLPPAVIENFQIVSSLTEEDEENDLFRDFYDKAAPTPMTQFSDFTVLEEETEENIDTEEEQTFMEIPDKLKDHFLPLDFVPSCTKEEIDDKIVFTSEKIEEAKAELQEDIENALQRMDELEEYNAVNVFGSQKQRLAFIESLYVDAQMKEDIVEAFNTRDLTLGKETVVPKKKN